MPFYNINNTFNNKSYKYLACLGFICTRKNTIVSNSNFGRKTTKFNQLFEKVNNPFLLSHSTDFQNKIEPTKFVRFYGKLLVWLFQHCYFCLYLLSKLSLNLFPNAKEATDVFCEIIGYDKQNLLCLPRSIFAATTSKRFKKHGGLFIGIFYPSKHLHAWVIEDDRNAWALDSMWINYTPISVML